METIVSSFANTLSSLPLTTRPQQTIAHQATLAGVGLFTNAEVNVRFVPAEANTGILFRRTDLPNQPAVEAHISQLDNKPRRTSLGRDGQQVEMVEHTLAALAGLQIDNCIVEVDGPEMPGLDGSSAPTVECLRNAEIVRQSAPATSLPILQEFTVEDEHGAKICGYPALGRGSLELTYLLNHPHPAVGRQSAQYIVTPQTFANDIAPARTFVLENEVEMLRNAGYGQKLTEQDLCVFGDDGLIGNELRFDNEPARHKLLDCIGDFALAGVPIAGRIVANRSGHALNHQFIRELLLTHVEVMTGNETKAA